MDKSHIHTPSDGRGPRAVFVDGQRVERVTYADTRLGLIRYSHFPLRANAHGEIVERTRRGKVEVRPIDG